MKVLAVALCVGAAATVANGAAIESFSGGSTFPIYYGASTGDVIGYDLLVNETILVTDLGCWIDTVDGVMNSTHEVGIWDSLGALVASAVVDPTTMSIVDGFGYQSIAGVTLNAGETYTIGASYTATDDDWYVSSASTLTTASEVTWVQSRYPTIGDLGFVFPELTGSTFGRIGPNFQFIPAPGALALFGLAGLGVCRRRR